ncbi:MAG: TPM domain-containing protein [Oscillospiraceae bacterium]
MEFFKRRSTALGVLIVTIIISFFIGRAKAPKTTVEVLPSGTYVQDGANIISEKGEKYITEINNGLVSAVSGEISVATIDTAMGENLFDMAIKLGLDMNLSANSCVMLISAKDNDVVIVQGEGLLGKVSDDELSYIINSCFTTDDFKQGKLEEPIIDSFDALINLYEELYNVKIIPSGNIVKNHTSGDSSNSTIAITLIVIILILMLIFGGFTRRRRPIVGFPVGGYGYPRTKRGFYPPSGTYPNRNSPPSGTFGSGSSRTGGFGSSSRGGSFGSSSSRTGGFGSSSRGGSFGGSSRGGSFKK